MRVTGLTCGPRGRQLMPVAGLRFAQTVSKRSRRARSPRRISSRVPGRPSAGARSLCDRPARVVARESPPSLLFDSRSRLSPPRDELTPRSEVWRKSQMRRVTRTPGKRRRSCVKRGVFHTHPLRGAAALTKRRAKSGQLQRSFKGRVSARPNPAARSRPLGGLRRRTRECAGPGLGDQAVKRGPKGSLGSRTG